MLTLHHFADRHKEWIKIAIYFGADVESASEIVQQMYLKLGEIQIKEGNLNKLINYNGAINTVYVFKVLQNLFYDSKKVKEIGLDYIDNTYINDIEESEQEYHIVLAKMKVVILSFNEYEQMLLELYFVHNRSLREINKRTGIGVHSIFNTIKNAKEKIRQTIEKDYKNYRDSGNKTIYWSRRYNSEDNESY
jgi:DNA-directed RNA polymerase specialized sigma subunit